MIEPVQLCCAHCNAHMGEAKLRRPYPQRCADCGGMNEVLEDGITRMIARPDANLPATPSYLLRSMSRFGEAILPDHEAARRLCNLLHRGVVVLLLFVAPALAQGEYDGGEAVPTPTRTCTIVWTDIGQVPDGTFHDRLGVTQEWKLEICDDGNGYLIAVHTRYVDREDKEITAWKYSRTTPYGLSVQWLPRTGAPAWPADQTFKK